MTNNRVRMGWNFRGGGGLSLVVVLLLAWTMWPTVASSQRDPMPRPSPWVGIGALELAMAERELEQLGLEPEHDPWNRTICAIHFSQLPIFLPEEGVPGGFNRLHVTSTEETVRAALTFEVGDPWMALDIRDTERALRDPNVYVTVTVLPVTSEDPDCIEALVVTRDLWSLRLSWDVQTVGSTVTGLYFAVIENNLAGTNASLGVHYLQGLGSTAIGPTLLIPRLMGSKIRVYERFELILDREQGGIEGTLNEFIVERPLTSVRDQWGWRAMAAHRREIDRRYTGSDVRTYTLDAEGESWSFDERWLTTEVDVEGTATRSFGRRVKHNFTLGGALSLREHEVRGAPEEAPQTVIDRYAELRLPRDERALGPVGRYDLFENRFLTLVNYETFELSEEVRLGVMTTVDLRLSEPYLGADRRFVAGGIRSGWTQPWAGSGFARAEVSQRARNDGTWVDVETTVTGRVVTPSWFSGRLVARADYREMQYDESNLRYLFGGDTGLRGFTNGAVDTSRYLQANLEWRSTPLTLRGLRLGMVAFFDSVTTFAEDGETENNDTAFYPAVGFGFRLVIPQLMANVRFMDIGFPLVDARTLRVRGNDTGFPLPLISLGADQAF